MSGVEALATTPELPPIEAPISEDQLIGDVWDRVMTNNGSDRGDDGRFKSPNSETETQESVLEGADKGEGAEQVGETPNADSSTPSEPSVPLPPSWQGRKETWENLTPDARQHIYDMETELNRKLADSGRQLASSKPIMDAVNEFKHLFDGRIDPAEGIRSLARAQQSLEDPNTRLQGAFSILQSYPGLIDQVAAVLAGQAQIPTSQQPQISASQIEEIVGKKLAEDRASQESLKELDELVKDKPLYPEIPIQTLVQFIYAAKSALGDSAPKKAVMDMAYEMATDSIPALKAKKVIPVQKTAVTTKPVNTEAAKRANSVNVTSNSTGKVQQPTLDQLYDDIWEKHHR